MTRDEATGYLGLPERQFDRLVAARLVEMTGRGVGRRYRAAHVRACAELWGALRKLLPPSRAVPSGEGDDDESAPE